MESKDLVQFIRNRYESRNLGYNQCVVLQQVPDGTGMSQSRWIDVVVFQMWESKGLTRSAFEVKVSRSDFLQELQHPEKHQWCLDCFHEFWFVAPKDIIQIEELPIGTGWMYPRGKGLAIARNAVRNRKPKLDDHLLAAFMRAAFKEIQQAGKTEIKTVLDNDSGYRDAKIVLQGVEAFLQKRGLHTYLYDLPDIQVVVDRLEEATLDKELRQDRQHLLEITGRFQREIMELLNLYLVLAKKSLLARDEHGRYIVSTYGSNDEEGLTHLKDLLKDKKANDGRKRYAEMVDLLMSWDGLKDAK